MCRRASIGNIFVQVYANGQPIYPSNILSVDHRFTKGGDPLARIITLAHHYGIKIHAWFNVFYIWGYSPIPTDPNHPINGPWEVYDREGRSIKEYSPTILKRMGIEGYFVSPFNESYERVIHSLIMEVIENYPIDGVHLDYIRYPSLSFGYDPWARTSFMRRYYVDPISYPEVEPLYRRLLIDGLTRFVWRITRLVHRYGLVVSAAVKPDPLQARREYGQDWLEWLKTGSIDFVVLMSYTPNTEWILRTIRNLKPRDRLWIGIGAYLLDCSSLRTQIRRLRKEGYSNLVIFSFEDLIEKRCLLSSR